MKTDIRQHDITDCAAACIVSIARHYGVNLPISMAREASGTSVSGTTIKGIIDACREIGFKAVGYKSENKEMQPLQNLKLPVILHIINRHEDLHFVVLYEIGRKKATIMDPATGTHKKILIKELQQEWTGYLVTMIPDPSSEKTAKRKFHVTSNPLLKYASLIKKRDYAMLLLCSATFVIAGIFTALFLQHIIDDVIPGKDSMELLKVGSLMVSLMICSLIIGYNRILFSLKTGIKLDCRLILGYIGHLFKLPVGFFSRRGAGELNSRIGDVTRIRSFLIEGIINIITSLLILVVSFSLMFVNHWRLSLLMLTFIPVYLGLYIVANKVNRKVNREIIENSAAFEEKTVESIGAVRIIKHFGGEERFFRTVEKQYCRLAGVIFKGGRYMGVFASTSDAISKILTITLLTTGAFFIFGGSLTIGELVSFYSLTAFFSAPLGNLVKINEELTEAKISSERICEITDLEPEGLDTFDCEINPEDDIVFDHISFSYPGSPELIRDLSITIPHGKITAIQGESGCGKSSLASLLMRDFKTTKGKILSGATDINLIDLDSWRRFISIIPQDAELLSGSILENITCFERSPDVEKVIRIMEDLGLRKFITDMPMGILTKIGERGCTLSGGQKQRIALARALYRDPQILILDEATSSLDEVSQSFVLKKVTALRDEGKTIIMITHKNDNASIADQLIRL